MGIGDNMPSGGGSHRHKPATAAQIKAMLEAGKKMAEIQRREQLHRQNEPVAEDELQKALEGMENKQKQPPPGTGGAGVVAK